MKCAIFVEIFTAMNWKLAIVLPCYNEEAIIGESVARVRAKIEALASAGRIDAGSCIIAVDDGSIDDSWSIIESIADGTVVHGVKLSHNAGHQNALLAGLEEALTLGADAVVTIDADLQDDIEAIDKMVEAWHEGSQIVYGVRSDRHSDSLLKRWSATQFYSMMNRSGAYVLPNHADFRLMSRIAVEMLLQYGERNMFLRGIVPMIGLKSTTVEYARLPRTGGESKYPIRKMLSFAAEGITSFTVRPVRMIFIVGLIFLIITISVAAYVLISMAMGRNYPGWASLMLSLWFIGSLVLIALGIIGEYVSKIYLEVKHRPRYFVERRTPRRPNNP